MIKIDDTLVADDIVQKDFVCNLSACKGACCVKGDAGAPVEESEIYTLEAIYDNVKPYLRDEGIKAIEEQGITVRSSFDEPETPLVNGEECAYVTFAEDGTALCGIEKAYRDGKVDFKKPVSCELYPVRTKKLTTVTALNYDRWDICDPACQLGSELQIPIYKFTKNALERKFGQKWYQKLESAADELQKTSKK
jgi:hypothetical protein